MMAITSRSQLAPDFDGKIALVTGGSRGLGYAIACALASFGAHVVLASRKLDNCESAAKSIRDQGGTATAKRLHVGHWHEIDSFTRLLIEEFGRIDILVNNAGVSPLYSSLSELSEELFDKVLDVNLKGPFRLAVLLAEHMRERQGGAIVNISSIAAVNPTPFELHYAAAKAGLNAATIGLAIEYGPHVRVNGIMAGPFRTDITASWDWTAFNEFAQQGIPMKRAGEPDEIAGTVLYLVSEMSSYTTGAVMAVDGGSSHSSYSPGDTSKS